MRQILLMTVSYSDKQICLIEMICHRPNKRIGGEFSKAAELWWRLLSVGDDVSQPLKSIYFTLFML